MIEIKAEYLNSLEKYKFIDLFSGIGGFHLALSSFGAKCVFASEIDKYAQKNYFENFGILPKGDITKINEDEIPQHDILCAGFPCQAFSISGKQLGFEDSRGTLFFEIARITKYHKPKILFLENVSNFEKHDEQNTLKRVIKILESLNYKVYYKVLNSSHFGIPQNRERIYILGFRKDILLEEFKFPNPPMIPIKLKNILLDDSEIQEFIINRDDIELKNKLIESDMFGNYPLEPIRIGQVNKGGQGERIYHEFGHAITLSAYGGGIGAKTGLYIINNKLRKLAPRECARLQGFPDLFKIEKSNTQAYKQFGNSVSVNVLQYIIMEIISTLNGRKEKQINSARLKYS
ncbi:MAG: DNA (cytosine-5-)-methyltransferase [Candidatus Sericytochromatia bacterium]